MTRVAGKYKTTVVGGEEVRAFVPHPLPPRRPPLLIEGELDLLYREALASVGRLALAGEMVPSVDWILYGFVRKEAVISSQIEGTQATLMDLLTYEAAGRVEHPAEVEEVCRYVEALAYARGEIARLGGVPLCVRLLNGAHRRLMGGAGGASKLPGEVRTSQNWIGGSRPGNARFVPPPPELVPEALAALEKWLHGEDPLPLLVRAGVAHAQFETIHPYLDGNGRIGRLLVTLLLEHWGLLEAPLLYLSLAFKRRREEYYRRLSGIRSRGDWEGWIGFFLQCVRESSDDGVGAARRIFHLIDRDRRALVRGTAATVTAVRLFDLLPNHPVITMPRAMELLRTTKPTAGKAISVLVRSDILEETTGKQRDRIYAYRGYLKVLAEDTESPA